MKNVYRNYAVLSAIVVFSNVAFAQYGPSSAGMSLGSGAGYGASYGGDSSESPEIPTIPDPTGSSFEKVGKLFDAGVAPDISVLLDSLVLENAVVVLAQQPSVLRKDALLVTFNIGDDVLGPILYAQTFSRLADDGSLFDYHKDFKDDLANGFYASPLAYNEEKNALVQSLDSPTSPTKCHSKFYLRVTQLENGKRALVSQSVHEDQRRVCNPDARGARTGQIYHRAYVVLPD